MERQRHEYTGTDEQGVRSGRHVRDLSTTDALNHADSYAMCCHRVAVRTKGLLSMTFVMSLLLEAGRDAAAEVRHG